MSSADLQVTKGLSYCPLNSMAAFILRQYLPGVAPQKHRIPRTTDLTLGLPNSLESFSWTSLSFSPSFGEGRALQSEGSLSNSLPLFSHGTLPNQNPLLLNATQGLPLGRPKELLTDRLLPSSFPSNHL